MKSRFKNQWLMKINDWLEKIDPRLKKYTNGFWEISTVIFILIFEQAFREILAKTKIPMVFSNW